MGTEAGFIPIQPVTDHNALDNLAVGFSHTQYGRKPHSEFFIDVDGNGTHTTLGHYRAYQIILNQYRWFRFKVPANFATLVAVNLWVIRNGGVATTLGNTIDLNFAASGEQFNVHTDQLINTASPIGADNEVSAIDIATAFTGLAAGDIVGVKIIHTSGSPVMVLGLEFDYTE